MDMDPGTWNARPKLYAPPILARHGCQVYPHLERRDRPGAVAVPQKNEKLAAACDADIDPVGVGAQVGLTPCSPHMPDRLLDVIVVFNDDGPAPASVDVQHIRRNWS